MACFTSRGIYELPCDEVFHYEEDYSEWPDADSFSTIPIVHEGIIQKTNLKGHAHQKIERFARLTPESFQIFKSKVTELVTGRPLETIPLTHLIRFSPVKTPDSLAIELLTFVPNSVTKPPFLDPSPRKVTVPKVKAVLKPRTPKTPKATKYQTILRQRKDTWTSRQNTSFKNHGKIRMVFDCEDDFGDWMQAFERVL